MNLEQEADRRVAVGASLLDQKMPGWAMRIDLNNLKLFDGQRCVLGQLFDKEKLIDGVCYANYDLGLEVLDLGTREACDAGFFCNYAEGSPNYGDLEAAWTRLIKSRHDTGCTL